MKNFNWWIKTVILSSILMWCWLPSADAGVDIDVEMRLNDGGFISFDHFKAELYLNNHGALTPGATIFGILEVLGEYFFWPSFSQDVNFEIHDIHPDESHVIFLEFDFENIDAFIPFGPMRFWGAWFLDMDTWNYDYKDFWLDSAHKWTPTPIPTDTPLPPTSTPIPTDTPLPPTSTPIPTDTPLPPTSTPIPTDTPLPPTSTPMPTDTPMPPTSTPIPTDTPIDPTSTPMPTDTPIPPTSTPIPAPGDLVTTAPIVGNMRLVPAGSFTQGSPLTEPCRGDNEAQFTHILTRNIAVMETVVSRQMWANLRAVQWTLPYDPSDTSTSPTMNHPVQQITWYEALLFANLLSVRNGFTRCYYTDAGYTTPVTASNYTIEPIYCNFNADGYRLPTEGEWEYFARAGTSGPFSCDEPNYNPGNCISCTNGTHPTLEQYCVYCANDPDTAVVVGSKLSNPWNLKDVHGNINEWCWDWFAVSYPAGTVTNYLGPGSGSDRVLRGGCWPFPASMCRSAFRGWGIPWNKSAFQGFRLVQTYDPDAPTPTPSPTPVNTPTPIYTPGDLVATDPIVGNMRFVPAGSFTQGSPPTEPCRLDVEGPQFTHILTKSIAVMETEVSRQMWTDLKSVQGTLPPDPSKTSWSPTMNHPVQNITWYESVLFANLLSLQNGFTRCYYTDVGYTIPVTASNYTTEPIYCNFNTDGYRLPTEGEWEYFTRAGTSGPFSCDEPNYNSSNCNSCTQGTHQTLEKYCVYCANSSLEAAVVGSKQPNPWNLKDVHGNVVEWCWDKAADSYPTGTVIDYPGLDSGSKRVLRGGSWYHSAKICRSAFRISTDPGDGYIDLGFRLVRMVTP